MKPKDYVGLSLVIVGGVADGYNQVIRHHYYRFVEIHPDHNVAFWGEDQWLNKYRLDENGDIIPTGRTGWFTPAYEEKFWGSSRWFVDFTDAHHLTRAIERWGSIGGTLIITMGEKKPWWDYALRFTGSMVGKQIGFAIIHDGIYR